MPQRLAFGPLGEARSLGCPATPPDRVAHFRSVHDLPVSARTPRTNDRSVPGIVQRGRRHSLEGGRAASSSPGTGLSALRGKRRGRHRPSGHHLSRPRQARQPGRALPDRPGDRTRRSGRSSVRQIGRDLSRVAGGDEGQRRLCAARSWFPDRAHRLHPGGREHQNRRIDGRLRRATRRVQRAPRPSRYRERGHRCQARHAPHRGRGRAAGRWGLLYHLYLGDDRQAQGGRR